MTAQDKNDITKRARPGRKPTGKGEPVLTRLQPEILERLDQWRAGQSDEPTRPEAIRRILTEVLKPHEPGSVDER